PLPRFFAGEEESQEMLESRNSRIGLGQADQWQPQPPPQHPPRGALSAAPRPLPLIAWAAADAPSPLPERAAKVDISRLSLLPRQCGHSASSWPGRTNA